MRFRPILAAVVLAVTGLAVAHCADDRAPAMAVRPPAAFVPPLQDAVVGETLRLDVGAESESYRVVSAGDYEVTVEVVRYRRQEPVDQPVQITWHRNSFGLPPNCVVRSIDEDRIEVGGVWYDCWRLSIYSRDVAPRRYWITDRIPVHGVLKVASVGQDGTNEAAAAKLGDWGPK